MSDSRIPSIEDSILWATRLHSGTTDKAGQPYILHPLRVMLSVSGHRERTAAVLHDVCEDCGVTSEMLAQAGYPPETIADLGSLTRREGETYEQFIERFVREASRAAIVVKLADLRDNRTPGRIANPGPDDIARDAKYARAEVILSARLAEMPAGT